MRLKTENCIAFKNTTANAANNIHKKMLHPNVYLIFRKKFFFIDSHATTKQQKIVTGFYDHGKSCKPCYN